MAIDVEEIFARGGRELIDVLNYSVRSVQVDPVFAFLVAEYRLFPTASKAIALYDAFIAPNAPARIDAADLLPPSELALQALIETVRPPGPKPGMPALSQPKPQPVMGKYIFDALDAHVRKNRRGAIARIKRHYNLKRTPTENLPGGKMTPGAKHFIDHIWHPRIRPALVMAGFRRIANIA